MKLLVILLMSVSASCASNPRPEAACAPRDQGDVPKSQWLVFSGTYAVEDGGFALTDEDGQIIHMGKNDVSVSNGVIRIRPYAAVSSSAFPNNMTNMSTGSCEGTETSSAPLHDACIGFVEFSCISRQPVGFCAGLRKCN